MPLVQIWGDSVGSWLFAFPAKWPRLSFGVEGVRGQVGRICMERAPTFHAGSERGDEATPLASSAFDPAPGSEWFWVGLTALKGEDSAEALVKAPRYKAMLSEGKCPPERTASGSREEKWHGGCRA